MLTDGAHSYCASVIASYNKLEVLSFVIASWATRFAAASDLSHELHKQGTRFRAFLGVRPIAWTPAANRMTGLLYSFVARDTTVLAEYSAIQGNFRTVAQECLLNAKISEEKFTITSDAYTFNFMVSNGYSECKVAKRLDGFPDANPGAGIY